MPADGQLSEVVVRKATIDDAPVCGQICFDAFSAINRQHGFPCDFPEAAVPIGFLTQLFSNPHFYCVVAEASGRVMGSNCLDERSVIHGVGPVTIDPTVQNRGIGRMLMQAAMERARQQGAAGIRLVQAAFHTRSLSLYAGLGFDVREHLACMQGRTAQRSVAGCNVRTAEPADLPACSDLSLRVHGFDRSGELPHAIERGAAKVVERDGRITAYASDLAFFGHAIAETNSDLQALIASVDSFGGPGILVPSRNSTLFRWCLANGLRVVQPMTLMTMGLYNEPAGAWLPSVVY
jgi:GNAT superfamily N-acetyltransferase